MELSMNESRTRRGLVAGALGGLAGVLGVATGRPDRAEAREADPDAVHKNVNNPTTASTTVTCNGAGALRGISTGSGTLKSGVFGQANGTNSRGVTGVGVVGVVGQSTAAAGNGVTGFVEGANATGVFANATSTTGAPNGVWGKSAAPDGLGVRGENLATAGDAYGVLGTTKSPQGAAVRGEHGPDTGSGAGVSGLASSPDGRGVEGLSTAASGLGVGVLGRSRSPAGRAILGVHVATSGAGAGVNGESDSPDGCGVLGAATGATGGVGVAGEATKPGATAGAFTGNGGALALEVSGPLKFTGPTGIATIPAGSKSVTVLAGVDITAAAKILCTLMSNPGAGATLSHVTKNVADDAFTVNLTANATADVKVAFFVIS
jgi:hypothetical protein